MILFNVFSRISLAPCSLVFFLIYLWIDALVLPSNDSGSLTHLCHVVLGWLEPSSDPDPTFSASPLLGSF